MAISLFLKKTLLSWHKQQKIPQGNMVKFKKGKEITFICRSRSILSIPSILQPSPNQPKHQKMCSSTCWPLQSGPAFGIPLSGLWILTIATEERERGGEIDNTENGLPTIPLSNIHPCKASGKCHSTLMNQYSVQLSTW